LKKMETAGASLQALCGLSMIAPNAAPQGHPGGLTTSLFF
jgi:hypothetical protein